MNVPLIIGIIILLAVIGGGGYWYFFMRIVNDGSSKYKGSSEWIQGVCNTDLVSPNKSYKLTFSPDDGSLTTFDKYGKIYWKIISSLISTGTAPFKLILKDNGWFGINDTSNVEVTILRLGKETTGPYKFILNDNGNLHKIDANGVSTPIDTPT